MEEYLLEKKYLKENIENCIDLNQRKNFAKFLEFICQSKKINVYEQNNIILALREKLILYLLNNNEYLDEFIIANLVTYQNIQKEIILNINTCLDFIKIINFIKIFIFNINLTSQIMSNCINLLNNIIEEFINQSNDIFKINEKIIIPILKLVELNIRNDTLKNDINYDIIFKDIYFNLNKNYNDKDIKKYF